MLSHLGKMRRHRGRDGRSGGAEALPVHLMRSSCETIRRQGAASERAAHSAALFSRPPRVGGTAALGGLRASMRVRCGLGCGDGESRGFAPRRDALARVLALYDARRPRRCEPTQSCFYHLAAHAASISPGVNLTERPSAARPRPGDARLVNPILVRTVGTRRARPCTRSPVPRQPEFPRTQPANRMSRQKTFKEEHPLGTWPRTRPALPPARTRARPPA
jgi:hypothetical protein